MIWHVLWADPWRMNQIRSETATTHFMSRSMTHEPNQISNSHDTFYEQIHDAWTKPDQIQPWQVLWADPWCMNQTRSETARTSFMSRSMMTETDDWPNRYFYRFIFMKKSHYSEYWWCKRIFPGQNRCYHFPEHLLSLEFKTTKLQYILSYIWKVKVQFQHTHELILCF